MLNAIALYFRYRSSCIISLRIVTTDLDLLSCASRKGKTDSDLIRNALLLWNNVVLCAIFKRKRVRFRFLRQYAVFCVVLKFWFDYKNENISRSICVYVVHELNMWIKRCYCSVCDCAACKSVWKCEKLLN